MIYGDIRDKIKSGDLLAWSHRVSMFASWHDFKVGLVRIFTRSEYSHVGTAFVMGGRVWVIEAVTPHPRIIPLSNALPFYWVPLAAPWLPETEARALALIGKDRNVYSQAEAVRGALGTLQPGKDDLWMCAEMSWCFAAWDGIDLGKDITPSGLVRGALELGANLFFVGESSD